MWKLLSHVWLFATPWAVYIVHGILQARILEWVAFPFSRGSSQPRDQTQVSSIAGRFFTLWATRETNYLSMKGSHDPLLRFNNLLEQLTECRETFYFLDYWFFIKGYTSGTVRWKRCVKQGLGKGLEFPCFLRVPFSLNLHVFNNWEALLNLSFLGFHGGFITQAWLIESLAIGD